jgi:1,4-alpha-glucan branching enzyme
VDFPRLGNDWSYQYARRQWSLVDTHHLRYRQLDAWDKVMIHLATEHQLLSSPPAEQLFLDPDKKILAYTRGGLIFVFSFHPTESFFGLPIRMPEVGTYHILLNSDEKEFGGFERLDKSIAYPTDKDQQVHLYVPNRVSIIINRKKIKNV